MPGFYRARNKRIIPRGGNGRFRRTTGADFGIGVCDQCGGLTLRVYEGPDDDPFPDPRKFCQRCFHCEPKTETELAQDRALADAKKSKKSGLVKMIEAAAASVDENK